MRTGGVGWLPASSMEECSILLRKGGSINKVGMKPSGVVRSGSRRDAPGIPAGMSFRARMESHTPGAGAGTSRRAHPAGGKGEHSSTAAPRGLPPFPPAFPAHAAHVGTETGFSLPAGLAGSPRLLPHLWDPPACWNRSREGPCIP